MGGLVFLSPREVKSWSKKFYSSLSSLVRYGTDVLTTSVVVVVASRLCDAVNLNHSTFVVTLSGVSLNLRENLTIHPPSILLHYYDPICFRARWDC